MQGHACQTLSRLMDLSEPALPGCEYDLDFCNARHAFQCQPGILDWHSRLVCQSQSAVCAPAVTSACGTAQVETKHVGRRAYKVKGLTERGASQMMFFNRRAARPLVCTRLTARPPGCCGCPALRFEND